MASTTPTRTLLAGVLASGVLGCSSSDAVVPQDADTSAGTTTTTVGNADSSSASASTGAPGSTEGSSTSADAASSTTEPSTDLPLVPCAGFGETRKQAQIYRQADVQGLVGVECVEGALNIWGQDPEDLIVDLTGLEGLQEVAVLNIAGTQQLVDLTGLEGLRRVPEGLFIGVGFPGKSEECPYNSALQNLDALSGLQVIDKDLWLCGANQDALVSIDGLDAALDGELHYGVTLMQLSALSGLSAFSGVTWVDSMDMNQLPALTDLSGLADLEAGYNLLVAELGIADFGGLESLVSLEGRLLIAGNPSLVTLDGLDALTSVDEVFIFDNPALPQAEAEAFVASLAVSGTSNVCGNLDGPPC